MTVVANAGLDAVQRRAVRVLVGSNVLGGVGVASGIAVGGLLAEDLSGSTSLAGLAQTGAVLGAALLALPLARVAEA
ncbi:MAG: MFS transporter, partial [Actinomycetota bacterium]